MIKTYDRNGQIHDGAREGMAILSGSFNPFHQGHKNALRVSCGILQKAGAYELSLDNCEKPSINSVELLERMQQFDGLRLIISDAALFVDKAPIMPNSTFVVGYDTAERLIRDSGSPEQLEEDLRLINFYNCKFIVTGRYVDGSFKTLKDLQIPENRANMFTEIYEDCFRIDISSTKIRNDEDFG